jgi:hypothetical protein
MGRQSMREPGGEGRRTERLGLVDRLSRQPPPSSIWLA